MLGNISIYRYCHMKMGVNLSNLVSQHPILYDKCHKDYPNN